MQFYLSHRIKSDVTAKSKITNIIKLRVSVYSYVFTFYLVQELLRLNRDSFIYFIIFNQSNDFFSFGKLPHSKSVFYLEFVFLVLIHGCCEYLIRPVILFRLSFINPVSLRVFWLEGKHIFIYSADASIYRYSTLLYDITHILVIYISVWGKYNITTKC